MKILVVRLSSLGDIIHFFPAVSDIHERFPEAEIHWLVEPGFAELVSWHKAIVKAIPVPLRAHKKTWLKVPALLFGLRRMLRAEKYDFVIDGQGLIKSALLARLAGVTVYGFASDSAREKQASLLYHKTASVPQGLHIVQKNRQLVHKLYQTDYSQPDNFGLSEFHEQQMQNGLPLPLCEITKFPCVILLHGTTWNSKYWPESSWSELIRMLIKQGWVCLLPWGNKDELEFAQRLKNAAEKNVVVLPKLTLKDLIGVILHAHSFISVESGIGHLAAVLDIQGVMLHGPTDPEYSGILDKKCLHLTSGLYCSPCFKRNCPRLKSPEDTPPCQQSITVGQVFQQFVKINAGEIDLPSDKIAI